MTECRLIAEFFDPHPYRREDTQPGQDWKCYEVTVSGEIVTNDREVVSGSARYFVPHELAEIAARTEAEKPNVDGFDWPWLRFFREIGLIKNSEGGV